MLTGAIVVNGNSRIGDDVSILLNLEPRDPRKEQLQTLSLTDCIKHR
jgi:hypothetical protein